jgi:hypothetical protein
MKPSHRDWAFLFASQTLNGTDDLVLVATDGTILFDDFLFEVDGAFVEIVGDGHVPEPGSAGLLLAGLLGFCGVRRKKN